MLTETKHPSNELTANRTKHQTSGIIHAINLPMAKFENTYHVVRPCGHGTDGAEADDSWDHTQRVQCGWDGQDAQADLGLHHEGNGT